ncbi:RPA-related protein RADX isoform X1 [Polypterus senegalus]|uniref:RPA-related protein RADX isoform X1 n=1 Tax=Polypterus senegalus TaxID=55291 RepID=UPI001964AC5C|nr:RPA-related protein RADX isoform X1 [Polypterus senegalus]
MARSSQSGSALEQLLASVGTRLAGLQWQAQSSDSSQVLAVLAVERYLADPPCCYSYDVTVTDGVWRLKCQLSSNLASLVQRNVLCSGSELRVRCVSFLYDERRLAPGWPCIEVADCVSSNSAVLLGLADPFSLPSLTTGTDGVVRAADESLAGSRKLYLSLWNNEDPYGALWADDTPPVHTSSPEVSKMIVLQDLENFWRSTVRFPPLLVKVMYKSRLRYYGRPEKKQAIPFQAYFEVADRSGMMSMVLWNSMCLDWYQKINVGSVIYVQRYSVKESYRQRTRPKAGDTQIRVFNSLEISLNARDPPADIQVIPHSRVKAEWGLPAVKYQFITRQELDSLPVNYTADVIGLVTYVGRCERIRKKDSAEDFWIYRWVHIIDGTSDQPFILEIFATSQPNVFSNIHPTVCLVCTQMRVVHGANQNNATYLTTSNETQIFITGSHKGQPYISDPKVRRFVKWAKTVEDSEFLEKTSVGGFYIFPPPPEVFRQSDADNQGEPLTCTSELQKQIEGLQYKERKRFAVQGFITAVEYFPWPARRVAAQQQHGEPDDLVQNSTTEQQEPQKAKATVQTEVVKGQSKGQSLTEINDAAQQSCYIRNRSPYKLRPRQRNENKSHKRNIRRAAHVTTDSTLQKDFAEEQISAPNCNSTRPVFESREGAVAQPNSDLQGSSRIQTGWNWQGAHCTSWQSTMWPVVKEHLSEHLEYNCLLPGSVPFKFKYDCKEFLMQQCNLHPAKWSPPDFNADMSSGSIHHLSVDGYYVITLTGLNRKVAISTVFLPVTSPEDPRWLGFAQVPHDNTLFSCLMNGFICSSTAEGGLQRFPTPDAIIQTASSINNKHIICLLDVCSLGGNMVEVFLSKVYDVT